MAHTSQDGQAGASDEQIEITPEMIVRGVDEMCVYDWERDDPSEIVSRIIKAVFEPNAVVFHKIKQGGS